ncbi:hypothetical protein ACFVT5_19785 [Streptomyces sp. NPDC058001]|uniref:hypothetical protein n=1 Tax=Streptomyces sp. NPDC058001 TaxID=3346300 RepID=UPI0036E953C3
MGEKPVVGEQVRTSPDEGSDTAENRGRKRLDLSVPQVAGSAVAAVVAAKLASNVGVYGTILGAGLVSAVATCGGSVFQHFFKRTGEQIRDAAVQTKPGARQVPVTEDGFSEGTVYRARVRGWSGWKRPLVAAGLVFGVTMGGITTYELVAGEPFDGGSKGTTIGDAFTGQRGKSGPDGTPSPSTDPSRSPSGDGGASGTGSSDGSPSDGTGAGTGTGGAGNDGQDQGNPSKSSPAQSGSGSGSGSGSSGSGDRGTSPPATSPTPSAPGNGTPDTPQQQGATLAP